MGWLERRVEKERTKQLTKYVTKIEVSRAEWSKMGIVWEWEQLEGVFGRIMFRVRVLREQIELSDPGVLGSLGRPAVLTMADVTAVEVVPKPLWTSVVTIYGLGFKWTKSVPDYVAEAFRGAVLEVRPDLARAS